MPLYADGTRCGFHAAAGGAHHFRQSEGGPVMMTKIDVAKPDAHVGLMLDSELVERLRAAIDWVRSQRRLGVKELAFGAGVAEHTVRNFIYGRSNRPSNLFLGRLYKYFIECGPLLPKDLLIPTAPAAESPDRPIPTILARLGLVRLELPISDQDLTS